MCGHAYMMATCYHGTYPMLPYVRAVAGLSLHLKQVQKRQDRLLTHLVNNRRGSHGSPLHPPEGSG
jgi:hypothetical protein